MSFLDRIRRARSGPSSVEAAIPDQTPISEQPSDVDAVADLADVPYSTLVRDNLLRAAEEVRERWRDTRSALSLVDQAIDGGLDPKRAKKKWQAAHEAELKAQTFLLALLAEVGNRASELDRSGKLESAGVAIRAALGEGSYSVHALSIEKEHGSPFPWIGSELFIAATAIAFGGQPPPLARQLATWIRIVGPEEIVAGVALDAAVDVKDYLERGGVVVQIKESRDNQPGSVTN